MAIVNKISKNSGNFWGPPLISRRRWKEIKLHCDLVLFGSGGSTTTGSCENNKEYLKCTNCGNVLAQVDSHYLL